MSDRRKSCLYSHLEIYIKYSMKYLALHSHQQPMKCYLEELAAEEYGAINRAVFNTEARVMCG